MSLSLVNGVVKCVALGLELAVDVLAVRKGEGLEGGDLHLLEEGFGGITLLQ